MVTVVREHQPASTSLNGPRTRGISETRDFVSFETRGVSLSNREWSRLKRESSRFSETSLGIKRDCSRFLRELLSDNPGVLSEIPRIL